ncbi:MAG: diaminopimelate epimerase [Candidatus Marinimicrobia bacterium]|nr:diaminopimelate epimerase [Candidatus Neomarinimicrobiota bacterium]
MNYSKYQALGNDYIVINPKDMKNELTPDIIRLICHRNYGVGSDGILLGPFNSQSCDFGLKIFNPDGSEAEKSGNGLRIFARSLVDNTVTDKATFTVETLGGAVTCNVSSDRSIVKVEMGKVSFDSTIIPVNGPPREVINEYIEVDNHTLKFCAATVGNPHCVVISEEPSAEIAHRFGPMIETNSYFPNRTNVQFMRVLDCSNIQIEIWERGAGYTLASGSSSAAAAAVAHRLGLCDSDITVHMPGGNIQIQIDQDFSATMTGPVTKVCKGNISDEMFCKSFK